MKFDKIGLLLAGAIGAFAAEMINLMTKGVDSSVLIFHRVMHDMLGLLFFNELAAVGFLLIIGAVVCTFYQPTTARDAFIRGTSVLSIFLSAVPNVSTPHLNTTSSLLNRPAARVVRVAYRPERAATLQVAQARINVRLETAQPLSENVTVTLLSPERRTLARSDFRSTSFSFLQSVGEYILRVETAGFASAECGFSVRDASPVSLLVPLEPSDAPVVVQRVVGSVVSRCSLG
jgi:hypothetical protein